MFLGFESMRRDGGGPVARSRWAAGGGAAADSAAGLAKVLCSVVVAIAPAIALAIALATAPALGQKPASWAWQPLPKNQADVLDRDAPAVVDGLIRAALQRHRLSLAPPADRRTLIRRLTFDLHGLPPSPAAVAAFEADRAPDSYERLVDRLLASPRYGERWARHWLDVAHYGETHGYDKDKLRTHAWPYRDWLIRALNADLDYPRFVTLQLAADVAPDATQKEWPALGFLAAGPWDFVGHRELREGTVEKRRVRSLDRDDMLTSVLSSFVSTTAHCARCHDHKFDPIPQRDYYRLQAVFAGVDRGNLVYEQPPARRLLTSGAATLGYHSAIASRADAEKWVQVDLGAVRSIDTVILFPAHEKFGGHPGPGFGFPRRFRIELDRHPDFRNPVAITADTGADRLHPGDQAQRFEVSGRRGRYVRVTATKLWKRTGDWVFALGEMAVLSGGQNLAGGRPVTALDSIEAGRVWGKRFLTDRAGFQLGKKVYAVVPRTTPRPVHLLRRGSVAAPRELVTPGALSQLPDLAKHFARLGEKGEAARRLALASWIVDAQNPLTWRTIANRVWQHHFVEGLVRTPNDFGNMGARPTHPELLDWLAVWFRDHGGSLKRLHRVLVRTATYRQASRRPADDVARRARVVDAGNTLLWQMRRRRLSAEETRDGLLAVSGRLDLTMGGPSARWFRFENDHSPRYDYRRFDSDGLGARRRSIYRHIVRSVPDPFLECLDGADASVSVPVRFSTLTALQALSMQNHPFVLRQSEHFAARLEAAAATDSARADQAWWLLLGRLPTATERAMVVQFAGRHGWVSTCRMLFNLNEFLFVD